MSIKESFLSELKEEEKSTRKLLEKIPAEYLSWKPHEKSFPLSRLASHVAELPGWISTILDSDELDFGKIKFTPPEILSPADIMKVHIENVNKAIKSLENAKEEDFSKTWTLKNNDKIFFTRPKSDVLKNFAYSHLYHHRGQLTVYLRLLDIPLPGIYGPTADEKMG
jgi:uncharacterized damage-inducible protein DinB